MLFNSAEFVLFALVFFPIWYTSRRAPRLRLAWLNAASFFFYGFWDWRFLSLLIGSGLLDFLCGLGMKTSPSRRRLLLGVSLVGNLGSLAVFKYYGFFADNATTLLDIAGLESWAPPRWSIALP